MRLEAQTMYIYINIVIYILLYICIYIFV
jgi:hypothetical protein